MSQNTTDKQAYLNATPMQREVVRRLLCDVLGCLRAQYLSYQTSHWQVVGQSFYGNHLLFERLYKSVLEQVDSLAEKLVGYLGREVVDLNHQMRHITGYTMAWSQIDCHHKRGIRSEQDLQAALRRAYDGIKQAQAMSLGLDDWIMATANAHEENEYLLQQALAQPPVAKQAAEVSVRLKGKEWSVEVDAPHQVAIYGPNGEEENGSLNRQLELEDFVDIPDEVLDALEAAIKKHSRKMRLGGHEGYFYKAPNQRAVLEFADSKAISNDVAVVEKASDQDHLNISEAQAVAEAEEAPPLPTEIAKEPGAAAVSTLNQYVIKSEDPVAEQAVPMNEARMASWLKELE